jgi:hypothetical protein
MTIDDEPLSLGPNQGSGGRNGKDVDANGKRRTFFGMHIGGGKDKDKEKEVSSWDFSN